jgi:hypothetical protein
MVLLLNGCKSTKGKLRIPHGFSLFRAVEDKFGKDDYRKALTDLLELKQIGSVEDYFKEFRELQFQVSMDCGKISNTLSSHKYLKMWIGQYYWLKYNKGLWKGAKPNGKSKQEWPKQEVLTTT